MATKKRKRKRRGVGSTGCHCPAGSVKKVLPRRGARCVEILKSGRWKFRKNSCS